jgi:hypothetical protein
VAYVFCNSCGHRNPPGSNFCSACGSALDHVEERTATLPAVVPGEESDDDGDSAMLVDSADVGPGTGALVVRNGEQAGLRFALLDAVTTLGRSIENDISLDDITVSRHHALVEREGRSYRVRDNGSLNGTYVNGQRITELQLQHGDEVLVGKFHFLFVLGAD